MLNTCTIGRCVALALFALALPASARAAEPYDGAWATSPKHCKSDGPGSLTVIDLKVNLDGKPTPMVEQYEHHCRIDRKSTAGNDTTLSMTCFEFWDDFRKKIDSRREAIKLSVVSKDLLRINGKQYRRCPEKAAAGKQAEPAKR